ncbi:MAG: methionine ABC transporter ATP-binding protein [Eubacteriales bacterium]
MIELRHVTKTFPVAASLREDGTEIPAHTFDALRDVSLTVADGEIYGIIGMSGAGKSTLVRCINMLERPSAGQVLIDGRDMGALSERELRAVRREVTMIFQSFNLLMQRTCLANICFPLELSGMKKSEAKKRARQLLETVGLPDKANAYPAQLSGGQQQRIAIARALATEPKVLLCDEATSALDPNTTRAILDLIKRINREMGITVIIITHQMSVVEAVCSRVAILDHGAVAEEGTVADIFANPKSEAAKRLVYPIEQHPTDAPEERFTDGISACTPVQDPSVPPHIAAEADASASAPANPGERVLRVVFNGSHTTDRPLIAQMAIDTGIAANILYASTRCIGDRVTGMMLLGIPDSAEAYEAVTAYLAKERDIVVTEMRSGKEEASAYADREEAEAHA